MCRMNNKYKGYIIQYKCWWTLGFWVKCRELVGNITQGSAFPHRVIQIFLSEEKALQYILNKYSEANLV